MYIKEVYIESFGSIKNKIFSFNEGFNLIYGKNETGKTTLLNFIVFVFYGFKLKKVSGELSFKQKYFPWDKSPVSGRVTFCVDGLDYEISRTFSNDKSFVDIICITTGESVKDTAVINRPGEYFIGVSADSFIKTAFITGLTSKINSGDTDEIITKVRNLYETGETDVSYKKTYDLLNEHIQNLSSGKRKNSVIPDLENKIRKTELLINNNKREKSIIIDYNNKYKANETTIVQLQTKEIKLKKDKDLLLSDSKPHRNFTFIFIGLIFTLISCIGFAFDTLIPACLVFACALFTIIVTVDLISKKHEKQRKDFTINDINDKIKKVEAEITELKIDNAVLKERIKNSSICDNDDLIYSLNELKEQLYNTKRELQGYKLALKALQMGYNNIKNVFSPALSELASNIFCFITNGRYERIIIDDLFNVNFKTDGGFNSALYLSVGTLEQAYLSLRIALCQLIFAENNVPMFFDETFAHYDDDRINKVLDYIYEVSGKRQVFCSTCKSEQLIYLKNKENINLILL